jgi:hypothetical protein
LSGIDDAPFDTLRGMSGPSHSCKEALTVPLTLGFGRGDRTDPAERPAHTGHADVPAGTDGIPVSADTLHALRMEWQLARIRATEAQLRYQRARLRRLIHQISHAYATFTNR